jgi:hypothetical protein
MAATTVTVALSIIQDLISAIPAGEALWNAIVGVRTANPNMTAAEAEMLMSAMTSAIATVGADEVATLALIPPVNKAAS